MSLKPFLSPLTGSLTEEARRHVRAEAVKYQRWLSASSRDGAVPCPLCHTRLDQPMTWLCPECRPYRATAGRR